MALLRVMYRARVEVLVIWIFRTRYSRKFNIFCFFFATLHCNEEYLNIYIYGITVHFTRISSLFHKQIFEYFFSLCVTEGKFNSRSYIFHHPFSLFFYYPRVPSPVYNGWVRQSLSIQGKIGVSRYCNYILLENHQYFIVNFTLKSWFYFISTVWSSWTFFSAVRFFD